MKITWVGHAAVYIEAQKKILIDPFLTHNPVASMRVEDVKELDAVVVTHDHGDHLGDTIEICKNTGAVLFSFAEIAEYAGKKGVKSEGMNVGGTVLSNGVSVSLVPAFHTGTLGGTAVGAVIEIDGKSIYHAGDTGLTLEMQMIGEMYGPDIAFLPIDGRYNMTPRLAAKAVELLKVPQAVPIHYNTFDAIKSSPEEFKALVGDKSKVTILNPGQFILL
ncbi:L-ascorbate metabolism protein UlaG (beta-lactamase superfamily) [Anaerobacterium chartisolvens]|uniref:UPF0173 metal-dependent hydrolase DFR58_13628 n=1 Tax=Anaerobacterium chartisolvens TaxID=1297424 RepID=A0A369AJ04_9FIRM|nr:metal-dependent hydrolase [Anaerobacterium chartisolvens]RCX09352.1 L-ascorbate metabolism protein UlaG (beta-lactamase superfamily) [Anaerobacterium chartisolvens]